MINDDYGSLFYRKIEKLRYKATPLMEKKIKKFGSVSRKCGKCGKFGVGRQRK